MSDTPEAALDANTAALLASIERGLQQAASGEYAAVHTPETIAERRRGRPVGSVAAQRRQPVTLRLPPETLAAWRASGKGWQTRAAAVLAAHAPVA